MIPLVPIPSMKTVCWRLSHSAQALQAATLASRAPRSPAADAASAGVGPSGVNAVGVAAWGLSEGPAAGLIALPRAPLA